MFYVYVLKSVQDKNLYIGYTNNLRERFKLHNAGKVKSTRARIPFDLIFYEAYQGEKDAHRREIQLKTISSQREALKRRLVESLK